MLASTRITWSIWQNRVLGPISGFLMLLVQGPHSENHCLGEYVISVHRVWMLCRAPGPLHLVYILSKGFLATESWWWLFSFRSGAWNLVRLTHRRQQVIVGGCVVGRYSLLSLGYWYTVCLAPDTFRYIHLFIFSWSHSHKLINMPCSWCAFLSVLLNAEWSPLHYARDYLFWSGEKKLQFFYFSIWIKWLLGTQLWSSERLSEEGVGGRENTEESQRSLQATRHRKSH